MLSFNLLLLQLQIRLYLLQAQSIVEMPSGTTVWTQLLTALVVGLLTAFAFQLLMTSLGIAIGVSALALRSTESDQSTDQSLSQNDSAPISQTNASKLDLEPGQNSHISFMAGSSILFTINFVLFAACFLATKFSQASNPVTGAIEGIVIWSAYFLLLTWISTTTVSSLIGSVVGATAGGFRRIVSTLTSALSNSENETMTEEQLIAAIREEMQTALDEANLQRMIEEQLQTLSQTQLLQLQPEAISSMNPSVSTPANTSANISEDNNISANNEHTPVIEFWQELESYLLDTSSKSLTSKRVDRKLQKLLQKLPADTPSQVLLSKFDRTALTQLLDQRDDLTDKKRDRVVNQIEATWQQISQEQFAEYDLEQSGESIDSESADSVFQSADASSSGVSQTLSHTANLILTSIPDATLKQALANLPELLQRLQTTVPNWEETAPIVLPALLTKLRASHDSTEDSSEQDSFSSNSSALKQTLNYLADYSQLGLENLNHALTQQIEHLQSRSMQQIESIQQAAQDRIDQVKQQAQNRLENARKAAATAAWWLFLTASTAAFSSALAGALATGWHITLP